MIPEIVLKIPVNALDGKFKTIEEFQEKVKYNDLTDMPHEKMSLKKMFKELNPRQSNEQYLYVLVNRSKRKILAV